MKDLSKTINKIRKLIDESDYILIGAGAGLSTAAGIEYDGKRFEDSFKDFIEKYDFTDMYTSSFYPFKSEEEKWAYWARHIYTNNTGMTKTPLYEKLLELVKNKDYFVITTNVDDQFIKSGFDEKRVYATQGSYRFIQCSKGCHNKVYDDTQLVAKMIDKTDDKLRIPSELVPKCPVCGENMDVNIRKDDYFVEDENWHRQSNAYKYFLSRARESKCLMLEFGVGFNTPGIIRFPFDTYLSRLSKWNLIRFNMKEFQLVIDYHDTYKIVDVDELERYNVPQSFISRYIPVSYDIETVIDRLLDK